MSIINEVKKVGEPALEQGGSSAAELGKPLHAVFGAGEFAFGQSLALYSKAFERAFQLGAKTQESYAEIAKQATDSLVDARARVESLVGRALGIAESGSTALFDLNQFRVAVEKYVTEAASRAGDFYADLAKRGERVLGGLTRQPGTTWTAGDTAGDQTEVALDKAEPRSEAAGHQPAEVIEAVAEQVEAATLVADKTSDAADKVVDVAPEATDRTPAKADRAMEEAVEATGPANRKAATRTRKATGTKAAVKPAVVATGSTAIVAKALAEPTVVAKPAVVAKSAAVATAAKASGAKAAAKPARVARGAKASGAKAAAKPAPVARGAKASGAKAATK